MSTVPSTNGAATGIRLSGRLTDGLTGAPMPNAVVDVYADRPLLNPPSDGFSDEFVLVTRTRTDEHGSFVRDFPLRPGWDYQARYFGGAARMGNLSKLVPADGSSFIELNSHDASFARSRKRVVTLAARVPTVRRGDTITFQILKKRHWTNVATRAVTASRTVSLSHGSVCTRDPCTGPCSCSSVARPSPASPSRCCAADLRRCGANPW